MSHEARLFLLMTGAILFLLYYSIQKYSSVKHRTLLLWSGSSSTRVDCRFEASRLSRIRYNTMETVQLRHVPTAPLMS